MCREYEFAGPLGKSSFTVSTIFTIQPAAGQRTTPIFSFRRRNPVLTGEVLSIAGVTAESSRRKKRKMGDLFCFHLPTRVEMGNGVVAGCAKRPDGWPGKWPGGGRVLLVTDPGVRATGLADEVWRSLREWGYSGDWFDLVAPNPRDHD